MQSLNRLREPAAIVLLVVLGLRLLLGLVAFVVLARGAADDSLSYLSRSTYGDNSFALASFSLAASVLDALTALVLLALVASCLLWPTPHGRPLALATLVVLGLGVVIALVAALVWLTSVRLSTAAVADFARMVLLLPLPLLGMVALRRLLAPSTVTVGDERPQAVVVSHAVAAPAALAAVPPPADEPTWQPDEAAGAAWTTAGDAAAGAAATGWGTATKHSGWVPAAAEERAVDAGRRPEQNPWG